MKKDNNLIIYGHKHEDEKELFMYIMHKVHPEYHVKGFNNSDELIAYFNDRSNILPAMLFIDMNFNGLTGVEALQAIRKKFSRSVLPVIMFSASVIAQHIQNARKYGANLYIRKPDNLVDLEELIDHTLYLINSAEAEYEVDTLLN